MPGLKNSSAPNQVHLLLSMLMNKNCVSYSKKSLLAVVTDKIRSFFILFSFSQACCGTFRPAEGSDSTPVAVSAKRSPASITSSCHEYSSDSLGRGKSPFETELVENPFDASYPPWKYPGLFWHAVARVRYEAHDFSPLCRLPSVALSG